MQFSVCGSLSFFTFNLAFKKKNFTKHLTSNCLDNIICNAICKFSAIRFIRLKGLMESETSILFYFCDNTKNLLVGETKPDRSQDIRTPCLPQLRQPYDNTTK